MQSLILQKPRQIILTETSRYDLSKKENQQLLNIDRKYSFHLPPIHRKKTTRYQKTVQNQQQSIYNDCKNSKSMILNSLSKQVKCLKQMGLLRGAGMKRVCYAGHIRIPTVHNDYHNSKTNAGFSRNKMGGIYPK